MWRAMTEASRPLIDLDRTWAAFDGPRVCGTFRSGGHRARHRSSRHDLHDVPVLYPVIPTDPLPIEAR